MKRETEKRETGNRESGKREPGGPPDLLILRANFGVTENGAHRLWAAGIPITGPDDIRHLLRLDAPADKYVKV